MRYCDYNKTKPFCMLYKYYSRLDFAIDAIDNNRIHFEKPASYNDIYDCSLSISYEMLAHVTNTRENMRSILKKNLPSKYHVYINNYIDRIIKNIVSVKEIIDYILKSDNNVSIEELMYYINNCIGIIAQPDNIRISCFSERRDSLLMWSYYANHHSGICLGFNIASDSILKNHCHKVLYSDQFVPKLTDISVVFYKSIQWSHEQEWRIVIQNDQITDDNEEVYRNTDTLSEIIVGAKMSIEDRNRLSAHLEGKNSDLSLFLSYPSNEHYKLLFFPVDNLGSI